MPAGSIFAYFRKMYFPRRASMWLWTLSTDSALDKRLYLLLSHCSDLSSAVHVDMYEIKTVKVLECVCPLHDVQIQPLWLSGFDCVKPIIDAFGFGSCRSFQLSHRIRSNWKKMLLSSNYPWYLKEYFEVGLHGVKMSTCLSDPLTGWWFLCVIWSTAADLTI